MAHKVLVIDDEWQARESGYRSFAEEAKSFTGAFELDLEILKDPLDLIPKLQTTQYAALLIDVNLTRWHGCTLSEIVRNVGNETPIALVSEYWDDTSGDDVNAAFSKPNCRTFFQWKEIAGEDSDGRSRAIRYLSKIIAEGSKLSSTLQIGKDAPIHILHISDLQFGGFADPAKVRLEAQLSADCVRRYCKGEAPTFVAFTGDVTERGLPGQFHLAVDWLERFLKMLNFPELPSDRFLVVPGNHDFCVPLSMSQFIKLHKSKLGKPPPNPSIAGSSGRMESQHSELLNFAYRPYLDFFQRVTDFGAHSILSHDTSVVPAWINLRFRHLGVAFYGLNTCRPVNGNGWPDRQVDAKDLAEIRRALVDGNLGSPADTLIVGLSHHSPVSGHEDRSVTNPEDFEKFFSQTPRTGLFLHGHVHERKVDYRSDAFRLVRSCAATLTKAESSRPADTLRGFSLLTLDRVNGNVVQLSAQSFEWNGNGLIEGQPRSYALSGDGMFREG